jgi:hypothetical protein
MSITSYHTNWKGGKGVGGIYHYNHWWKFILKKKHPSKWGKKGTMKTTNIYITKWYITFKSANTSPRGAKESNGDPTIGGSKNNLCPKLFANRLKHIKQGYAWQAQKSTKLRRLCYGISLEWPNHGSKL